MEPKLLGIAAALGSAASWALGSILFKRLGERLSSPAMTLVKQILSVLLLTGALGFVGFQQLPPATMGLLMLSGLLGIALGDTFFFAALQDLGPVALVVLLTLGQVLTVALAVVILGESPSPWAWVGIVLVICGVGTVLLAKIRGEQGATGRRGLAFGLASVACMSVSVIIAKMGLESVSALQATFLRMAAGAVAMFLFGLASGKLRGWVSPFRDLRLGAEFLAAVVLITFGGFWLSLVAIKYVDVSLANTLASVEPVLVLPFAVVFLREKASWSTILGTLVTVAGVVILVYHGE